MEAIQSRNDNSFFDKNLTPFGSKIPFGFGSQIQHYSTIAVILKTKVVEFLLKTNQYRSGFSHIFISLILYTVINLF